MIVIVEGIDRVGKSRFVKSLVKDGFVELKSKSTLDFNKISVPNTTLIHRERILAQMDYLKMLYHDDYHYVIDRFNISQYVYTYVRRGSRDLAMLDVQHDLNMLNALTVLIKPANKQELYRCIDEDGHSDLEAINHEYKVFVEHSCDKFIETRNDHLSLLETRNQICCFKHMKEYAYDN